MGSEPKKEKKNNNAEKPVSLFGAKFEEVLGALLKTKPKPKEENKNGESSRSK